MPKKEHLNILLFLLLNFFLPTGPFAQSYDLDFKQIGTAAGINDIRFNAFAAVDSKGFVWIGSLNGIYRYNGDEAKHYPIKPKEGKVSYNQMAQSSFYEDLQSNLWFTTYDALHCYVREKDDIISFALTINGKSNLEQYHAFHIEKSNGILWLLIENAVCRFDVTASSLIQPAFRTNGIRFRVDTFSNGTAKKIVACPWDNEKGVEVWQVDGQGTWRSKIYDKGWMGKIRASGALIENDSVVWLATNRGLTKLILGENGRSQKYAIPGTSDMSCWDLEWAQDDQGILVSTGGGGLWYFDLSSQQFVKNWVPNETVAHSITSDNPKEIYASSFGVPHFWISHYQQGLDLVKGEQSPFTDPFEPHSFSGLRVKNILEDRDGRIWVLTKEEGVMVFDKDGQLIEHKTEIGNTAYVPGSPAFLCRDRAGHVFLALGKTIFQFVGRSDGTGFVCNSVCEIDYRLESIFSGKKSIYVISTNGVFELTEKDGRFDCQISDDFLGFNQFEFDYFVRGDTDLIFIPKNSYELWVAREKENGLSVEYRYTELNGDVYAATPSQFSDTVWLATEKGIYYYVQDVVAPYVFPDGSEFTTCSFSIVEDEKGNLWIGTTDGLWLKRSSDHQLVRFGKQDGLRSEIFTPNSSLLALEGKIWMGTEEGLIVFHPDSVSTAYPVPNAHIEMLWVNSKKYLTQFAIGELNKLDLNYYENTLEFELQTVSPFSSDENELKYRLVGYDTTWAFTVNGGIARFTKVPPGKYELQVVPINANQLEGKPKTLQINIPPPFWQTTWFRAVSLILLLALFSGIVASFYRRKLIKQKRLLEKQKALNAERDRIAKELHDDLGGDLSTILFIGEDILLESDSYFKKDQKRKVDRIVQLAAGSLENMREIIWALDNRKNKLSDLISHLRIYIVNFLNDNKIQVNVDLVEKAVPELELSSRQRRNIYLIIKEALHNIVKHASAQNVHVFIQLENSFLSIKIVDNGVGFEIADQQGNGDGLINMQSRTDLINGTLYVKSNPSSGTSVFLKVPLN
ncbi:MAG: two-component regulator propeller domain-containing protein [Bacteroidota bacterium]